MNVFRTIADPFAGRINVMKVISGHVKADATVHNTTRGTAERLGAGVSPWRARRTGT